jgi:hypothetical protein
MFSIHVQTGHGPRQPAVQWISWFFPREKWPLRGRDHPPPSRAEVKMGTAIPLLPGCAFMSCYRVSFVLLTHDLLV